MDKSHKSLSQTARPGIFQDVHSSMWLEAFMARRVFSCTLLLTWRVIFNHYWSLSSLLHVYCIDGHTILVWKQLTPGIKVKKSWMQGETLIKEINKQIFLKTWWSVNPRWGIGHERARQLFDTKPKGQKEWGINLLIPCSRSDLIPCLRWFLVR